MKLVICDKGYRTIRVPSLSRTCPIPATFSHPPFSRLANVVTLPPSPNMNTFRAHLQPPSGHGRYLDSFHCFNPARGISMPSPEYIRLNSPTRPFHSTTGLSSQMKPSSPNRLGAITAHGFCIPPICTVLTHHSQPGAIPQVRFCVPPLPFPPFSYLFLSVRRMEELPRTEVRIERMQSDCSATPSGNETGCLDPLPSSSFNPFTCLNPS